MENDNVFIEIKRRLLQDGFEIFNEESCFLGYLYFHKKGCLIDLQYMKKEESWKMLYIKGEEEEVQDKEWWKDAYDEEGEIDEEFVPEKATFQEIEEITELTNERFFDLYVLDGKDLLDIITGGFDVEV